MFFPYKMDSGAKGLPLFTVLICVLSCWVFWQQYTKDAQYQKSITNFCQIYLDEHAYRMLELAVPDISEGNCHLIFDEMRQSHSVDRKIKALVQNAKPLGIFASKEDDRAYLYNRILEHYRNYDMNVPVPLAQSLHHQPHGMDISHMITSTFTHADIYHLLVNVLIFYIFAAAVERIIGNLVFILFISVSVIGTQLAYSFALAHTENSLPLMGLSGVVIAAIGALASMIPFAQIRCIFWLVFIARATKMPAIFLALCYVAWVGWNTQLAITYNITSTLSNTLADGRFSLIHYTPHFIGAIIGFLFGFYYNLFDRKRLQLAANPS